MPACLLKIGTNWEEKGQRQVGLSVSAIMHQDIVAKCHESRSFIRVEIVEEKSIFGSNLVSQLGSCKTLTFSNTEQGPLSL